MKRFALHSIACLFLCATASFASKPANPADYTVNVHISSSRTAWVCTGITPDCRPMLVINATVDGAKLELQGSLENDSQSPKINIDDGFLSLGDYKAMLVLNKKDPGVSYFVMKSYELLLSDGRLAKFWATGQSE